MNKSRVLLNFMTMNWKELGPMGSLIISILYTAAFFTSPPVAKAAIQAAIDDLRDKGFVTLRRCSTPQMNARIAAENHLRSLLRKNADYVNMMSEGDRARILESGYDVYTPEYSASATVFTVINTEYSGQVYANWPADVNNHGYVVRYSLNEDGHRDIYTEVNAGNTNCTIDGLIPGKVYLFSYCVVYSTGNGAFCEPVSLMVM